MCVITEGKALLLAVVLGPAWTLPAALWVQASFSLDVSAVFLPVEFLAQLLAWPLLAGMILVIPTVYAYGLTWFYGLPVYFWLRRHNRHDLGRVCLAALLPTWLLYLLWFGNHWNAWFFAGMTAAALLTATSCWLIARAGEKKAQPPASSTGS